jgi:flagellar biosynthetic protein FliO
MEYILVFFALLFVLGLMIAVAWGIKKLGILEGSTFLNPMPPKNIKLLEQSAIDTKRRIIIVQIGQQKYALLTSPQGDVVIDKNITIDDVEALKSKSQE